jgi:hypothetical protein
MLAFCSHSLFKEYGWQFIRQIALPHPMKTARAVIRSCFLDLAGNMAIISEENSIRRFVDELMIVGVGFCQKPMDPPCLSGRPNHSCHYFEHLHHSDASDIPICCRQCAIREIGIMTRKRGAAFYIMTSAKDILCDVFKPALDEGRFSSGIFMLCRYSMKPFAVAMLAAGIKGYLFPFKRGDCRDYKTWLQADRGTKEEQTEMGEQNQRIIRTLLEGTEKNTSLENQFERQGNIFFPVSA